jgi:4-amino-4-deoxy-L-arabinose transferase-like glycosyltransferase
VIPPPRERRGVLLVLLLALVVRLAYLGLYYNHASSPALEHLFRAVIPSTWSQFRDDLAADRLFSDQEGYDHIARSLLAGEGYRLHDGEGPTAFRPPVYPFLLAAVYATGGEGYLRVRILQLLLELGTVLLLYAISRRVFGSPRAALAGAGLYALYFPMVIYSVTLFSETVFTFLLALFVWLMVRARDGAPAGRGRRFLVAGLALGLVTLTKPTTMLLPFFLLLPILLARAGPRSWGERARGWWRAVALEVVPVALGMCLVIAPWTIRNAVALGEFVPVATGGGRVLWGCNYIPSDDPMIPEARGGVGRDAPVSDRGFYLSALKNIASHPATFAGQSFRKFVRLWFNLGFEGSPSAASLAIGAANLVMALLLAWSLIFARGPWVGAAMPMLLLLVYFSLVHMVLEGYIRYALPVIPYLMLVASYGGVMLAGSGRLRMGRS